MIEIVLTSSVIAAIVAAVVALWTTQKRISIENITQDRRAWREKVRNKALAVHDALITRDEQGLNRLRAEFRAILNPEDDDDNGIVACIKVPGEGQELELAEEFSQRITLLLKNDWERVKLEAGPVIFRIKGLYHVRKWISYNPKRVKYKR